MHKGFRKAAWATMLAAPALLATQAASAALVTEWDYQVNSTFTDFSPVSNEEGAIEGSNPNDTLGGSTTLTWGASEPQSSISIDSDVDGGGLMTNGPAVAGATFTHNNNDIEDPNDVSLESFVLSTQLMLTATSPDELAGSEETVGPITFNSQFIETDNQGSCFSSSVSQCDDIFVLTNDETINFTSSFSLDGVDYTVFLDVLDLGPLTDEECSVANAESGCIGFITQEGQVNNFATEFRIEANEPAAVPEPGTLALLGLGLVGVGVARRKS